MKRILIIPLAAYGHIVPLLELAKKLSAVHQVSFVLPEYLADDVRPRSLPTETSQLYLHVVHDGYPGMPEFGKTSMENLYALDSYYKPKLQEFVEIIAEDKTSDQPDAVIIDNFRADIAVPFHTHKIPVYHFNTSSAGKSLKSCQKRTHYSLWTSSNFIGAMHLKALYYDDTCPVWDCNEGTHPIWEAPENGLQPLPQMEKNIFSAIKMHMPDIQGVIINSAHELDVVAVQKISGFEVMKDKPMFMVGPLIPEDNGIGDKHGELEAWMMNKPRHSVIYVSFGTVMALRPAQITELGQGLLLAKKPFIISLSVTYHKYLPESMQNQIPAEPDIPPESPFLVLPWVPQRWLLSHPSTGIFVSHCGWNSTLEALSSGVPVVGWPTFADQGTNAQLLVECGLGVTIEGAGMKPKRLVSAEEIAGVVQHVICMSSFRTAGENWKKTMQRVTASGGSSYVDLQKLTQIL